CHLCLAPVCAGGKASGQGGKKSLIQACWLTTSPVAGSPAIWTDLLGSSDRRLCVPALRRVCLCRGAFIAASPVSDNVSGQRQNRLTRQGKCWVLRVFMHDGTRPGAIMHCRNHAAQ